MPMKAWHPLGDPSREFRKVFDRSPPKYLYNRIRASVNNLMKQGPQDGLFPPLWQEGDTAETFRLRNEMKYLVMDTEIALPALNCDDWHGNSIKYTPARGFYIG